MIAGVINAFSGAGAAAFLRIKSSVIEFMAELGLMILA